MTADMVECAHCHDVYIVPESVMSDEYEAARVADWLHSHSCVGRVFLPMGEPQ